MGTELRSIPSGPQKPLSKLLAFLCCCICLPLQGQEELLDDRWFKLEIPHFTVYSQVSSRQTRRVANELNLWRQVAAFNISSGEGFPVANVPNIVFLFDDSESFSHFTVGPETAFFYPTPRSNFMAFLPGEDASQSVALHQYAHFLEKNFADLRIPRWYEEGLAGYLARINIDRGKPEFTRVAERSNEILAEVSSTLPMERLLYRDDALASPRMIQIANLKSEALLYYLKHAYEEDGYPDRRQELAGYLELLFAGRNQRFAFDQSFSVTTKQLDVELEDYLLTTSRPSGTVEFAELTPLEDLEPVRIQGDELALMLGELALNSGGIEQADVFFNAAIEADQPAARAYSGLGDALRFQEAGGNDQEIAAYFEMALERAPDDLNIMLDYGEYWESELESCGKTYPVGQRQLMLEEMKTQFERAVALGPDSAEANLAMAEYYLLEGQDWRQGRDYQRRAFELLPADGFIMEQTIKYAIAAEEFDEAERLISEMAQPLHYFGEPAYVTELRDRLSKKRQGEEFDACTQE